MKILLGILVFWLAILPGCTQDIEPPKRPPRPVSYMTIRASSPEQAKRLSGTVENWKSVQVGFEVPGRVAWMIDQGAEVAGKTLDINGKTLSKGTVIARLDDERYRIALKERQALLASAHARLKAIRMEIEKVLPAKMKAARADLALQKQEITRYTRMVAERSAPQEKLDRIEAAYAVAQSAVAEIEAVKLAKRAELEMARSQVLVAEGKVESARLNLKDCTLIAPFSGQIAGVRVNPGAYVIRAQPALTVQMMDPIKVQVAVSPSVDVQIQYNDRVTIHLPEKGEILTGHVYFKDTAADSATRTFLITILVRNRLIKAGKDVTGEDSSAPRATGLFPLQRRDPDGGGPWFAEAGCLYDDGAGAYVWAAQQLPDSNSRVKVRKVRVKPGVILMDFIQIFTFREMKDIGDLVPESDLLLRGVTGNVKDGDEVRLVRKRWLLRPGEVVQVSREGAASEPGFYVPEEAIRYDGKRHFIFLAESLEKQPTIASRVQVRVGTTVGALQRIESMSDGRLAEGMEVIVAGASYVADGEKVNPIEEVFPRP